MGYRYPYLRAVIFSSHLVSGGQATEAVFQATGEHQLVADSDCRRQTAGDEDPSVFFENTDSAAPSALDDEDKEPHHLPAAFLDSEVAGTTGRRKAKTHEHTKTQEQNLLSASAAAQTTKNVPVLGGTEVVVGTAAAVGVAGTIIALNSPGPTPAPTRPMLPPTPAHVGSLHSCR
eukprot:CAMPEP_0178990622 /NCGR_PEP_ID=MMETSP0795-20121207/5062_1 /TAXON_ID=88552 /ORGANISM="Amoebophrya sp., Strain Ameob2" /LENGTH=174 /DNA_ID=CAMNT_0020682215 /DNA_START=79 /DNA_END=603 /DNA_ORIENTATION=-